MVSGSKRMEMHDLYPSKERASAHLNSVLRNHSTALPSRIPCSHTSRHVEPLTSWDCHLWVMHTDMWISQQQPSRKLSPPSSTFWNFFHLFPFLPIPWLPELVTWNTEIRSNAVFISNPFPLCLIYCYIFKCTNSYSSFIHKTTGIIFCICHNSRGLWRDGWIDVLCCHLVLWLFKWTIGLFISLEMRKQRQLKEPKFWNSHWYALLNRRINDIWTIFPGTKQLNLFSHNGSLHPWAWLAKLWPSTLEAPDLNPNWLGNKMPL